MALRNACNASWRIGTKIAKGTMERQVESSHLKLDQGQQGSAPKAQSFSLACATKQYISWTESSVVAVAVFIGRELAAVHPPYRVVYFADMKGETVMSSHKR
jgi:hypothetical protein